MTILELRQAISDITRDPNNRVRPSATVDRAINKAYKTVQQELESMIDDTNKTSTISIIAWTTEYSLPASFLVLQTARINTTALFRTAKKKIVELEETTSTGSPICYYLQGGNIWLYPIPNQSDTLTLEYTGILDDITTVEDAVTPSVLDYAIVYKASALLFLQVQKINESQIRENEYNKEIMHCRYTLRWDENLNYKWIDVYETYNFWPLKPNY